MTHPRTFTLALAVALVALIGACGDDGADVDADGAADGEAGTVDEATVDPTDPCSLLTEDDFVRALDATVDQPSDVSTNFGFAETPELSADSRACQWQATTGGDDAAVSSFSVELVTVVGADATAAYDAEVEFTEQVGDPPPTPLELPGDRAAGHVDMNNPEILAQTGDVTLKLTTSSEDVAVDDLAGLLEAALERIDG